MSFQAAPERDVDLRSKALILAEDLREAVRDIFSHESNLSQLAEYGALKLDTTLLPGSIPGLKESVNVSAVFAPIDVNNPNRIGVASHSPPAFTLFLLPAFDYTRLVAAVRNPRNPRHRQAKEALVELQYLVDKWFDRHISAVVHELIHLFDFIRAEYVGQKREVKSREEYVSDPWEYNAHFQHMLVELAHDLRQAPGWAQQFAFESFEAFVEFAAQTRAGSGFLPYLTPKYRRKALSRLWQTWDHMREQVFEAEREKKAGGGRG